MALINFDCPECGHNLEVETEGAGSIVDCPECHHPLQIPELPSTRLRRRLFRLLKTAFWIALGLVGGLLLARSFAPSPDVQPNPVADVEVLSPASLQDPSPEWLAAQDELAALRKSLDREREQSALFARNALDLADIARALSARLLKDEEALFSLNPQARDAFLRKNLRARIASPDNELPVPPVVSDVAAGQGLRNSGQSYVFPELLGRDGQILRKDAEITAIDGAKVSVKFPGGVESFSMEVLHPGVLAALPNIDVLLSVPAKQRPDLARRDLLEEAADRDAQIDTLSSVFPEP